MKKRIAFRRHCAEQERGQATVEFAVSVLTIIFIVLCSWELLMAMYTASVLANAAKEGVRYAIVNGSSASAACTNGGTTDCTTDPAGVGSKVKFFASTSLHDISAITVNVTYPDGSNDPGKLVKVTVTYSYIPYVSGLAFFNPTLSTRAEGRIVY